MAKPKKTPVQPVSTTPNEPPDDDDRVSDPLPSTIEELRSIGAATSDAVAGNKRAVSVKNRKQRGDKNVLWNQQEDKLYELIMATWGNEQLSVRIKRTSPDPHDFGRFRHTNLRTYESLMAFIDENCWDGSKSVFRWEVFRSGWVSAGGDDIPKEESPLQRAKFTARNRAAAQELLGSTTQAPVAAAAVAATAAPIAPVVAPVASVVAPAPSVANDRLSEFMGRLEERLDEIEEKLEELDEPELKEPQTLTQTGPISMPPSTQVQPDAPQYESFSLPDGTIGWRTKVVQVPPPANFPPPPAGFVYQQINGAWQFVSAQATPTAPLPVAPPSAVLQQPVPTSVAGVLLPQEREMLERAHNLETELAVIKAQQKIFEDQRRQEAEGSNQAPHQAPSQPAQTAPPGYQWACDPSGRWQAVPIPTPTAAPAAPVSATAASSISALARDATEIGGAFNKLKTVFGGEQSGGFFPKAGEATASAVAATPPAEPKIPLEALDVGGDVKLWWNHEEKKFVDGPMQAVMNLPVAVEGIKSFGKDIIGAIREAREEDHRREDRKIEQAKKEAQDYMRRQNEVIQRQNAELQRLQRERASRANGEPPTVDFEATIEPPPAPPNLSTEENSVTSIVRSGSLFKL